MMFWFLIIVVVNEFFICWNNEGHFTVNFFDKRWIDKVTALVWILETGKSSNSTNTNSKIEPCKRSARGKNKMMCGDLTWSNGIKSAPLLESTQKTAQPVDLFYLFTRTWPGKFYIIKIRIYILKIYLL